MCPGGGGIGAWRQVGELGWRNVLVGVSLHRLALLLVKEGCFDDAEQLYRQSLEIHSKICGLVRTWPRALFEQEVLKCKQRI